MSPLYSRLGSDLDLSPQSLVASGGSWLLAKDGLPNFLISSMTCVVSTGEGYKSRTISPPHCPGWREKTSGKIPDKVLTVTTEEVYELIILGRRSASAA
jgi:hypothetical protein